MLESQKNIKLKLYNKINEFYEFIDNNYNFLHESDKKILIDSFTELNWDNLFKYYKLTQRQNLLSYHYILTRLAKKNKIKLPINLQLNSNTGLQEMLWEFLNPDNSEFS